MILEPQITIVPALPGFFIGGLVGGWDDPENAALEPDDCYSFVPIVAWRIETRVVKSTDKLYPDSFASVAYPICSDPDRDESQPGDSAMIRSDGKVETFGRTFASLAYWFKHQLRESQAAADARADAKGNG